VIGSPCQGLLCQLSKMVVISYWGDLSLNNLSQVRHYASQSKAYRQYDFGVMLYSDSDLEVPGARHQP